MDIKFLKLGTHIAFCMNAVLRIYLEISDNWRCCRSIISAENIFFKGLERCGTAIFIPMCHL